MSEALDKLRAWWETDEAKDSMIKYCNKIKQSNEILNNQLERFHIKYGDQFETIVNKINNKYNSSEYKQRWYKRSIEPPTDLYFFLYEYAVKYGRKCNKKEWNKYSNMFTASLYFINNYYIGIMNGQGSVVQIDKKIIK